MVSLASEVIRLERSRCQRLPSQISQPQVGTYLGLWPCCSRRCRALLWSMKYLAWVGVELSIVDAPLPGVQEVRWSWGERLVCGMAGRPVNEMKARGLCRVWKGAK